MLKIIIALFLISSSSFASSLNRCKSNAAKKTLQTFPENFIESNGDQLRVINYVDCLEENNIKSCEVITSDGEGAHDIFYEVTLSKNCSKVFGVKIIYIE